MNKLYTPPKQWGFRLLLTLIVVLTMLFPSVAPLYAAEASFSSSPALNSSRVLPGWWQAAPNLTLSTSQRVFPAWSPPGDLLVAPRARLLAQSITELKIEDEAGTEILTKTLTADESFLFYAVGYGPSFSGTQEVTWTLSFEGIGDLSASRASSTTLDAKTAGWSILTATLVTTPTISTTARITVTPGVAASLVLSPSNETLTAGQSSTYVATAYDQDNNLVGDVTSSTTFGIDTAAGGNWSSNLYTSEKAGDWIVSGVHTNTQNTQLTDTANLTVNAGALTTITVTPEAAEVTVGKQKDFDATGTDQYENPVTVTPDWDSDVGSVDAAGLFTARTSPPGTGVVTATQGTVSGQATVTVTAGPVDTFYFIPTQISTQTAGVDFGLTIEARDVYSNVVESYNGTANLEDSTATVAPGSVTFTDGVWNGVVSVTLAAEGVVITATDGITTGHSSSFDVLPADLDHFTLEGYPASRKAGVQFPAPVVVTAYDRFDNLKTNYTGTVVFSSSDVSATLPGDYNFDLTDAGAHSFPAGDFVLYQTPNQVITVTDQAAGVSQASASIEVIPTALDYFELTGYPSSTTAGDPFPGSVTVAAYDRFDNLKTNYTGTVEFSSDDASADLPDPYLFTEGDAGDHDFDGAEFALYHSPYRTITVTDQTQAISQASALIEVIPADLYRFEMGSVTIQEAGISFQLTITAYDQWDNAKYNYSGTPGLSDATGTLLPTQIGAGCFSGDGVCEQSVVITRAWTADQITVTDGAIQAANGPFDVIPTTPDHVRINSAADNGGETFDYPVEVGARETDIYETHTFWAGCYDQYDNYRSDVSADWGLTGVLAQGTIEPDPAISATLTPAPVLSGTGTITASASTCGAPDETGEFHIKAPRLVVSKSDNKDPVSPGKTLAYTIRYTNTGNAVAQGVRITETYDPNVSFELSLPDSPSEGDNVWDIGQLGVGKNGDFSVVVRVDNSLEPGTMLTNLVTIGGSRLAQHSFTETTVITSSPDLTLTLNANRTEVNAGGDLVYKIDYANNGTAPVFNLVITMVHDVNVGIPLIESDPPLSYTYDAGASTIVWTRDQLDGSDSGTIDVTVSVDDLMEDLDTLYTVATIDSDQTGQDDDFELTTVYAPKLVLTKVTSADPAPAFERLTYTLIYSNVGHAPASALYITDAVPANTDYVGCQGATCSRIGDIVTWQPGGLAAQSSDSVKLLVDVHRNLDTGTVLTNRARVYVFATPGYSATAQITTTVVSTPSIWVQINDGRTAVEAGEDVVYTLDFGNDGSGRAYSATIVVTPPVSYVNNVGCLPTVDCFLDNGQVVYELGTVDGGAADSVRMVVQVDDPLPAGADSIMAFAVIDTVTPGDPVGDNLDQDEDDIATRPDLIVRADYESLMPYPGKRVTYTVHFSNEGHIATTGVVLTATQPEHITYDPGASDSGWVSLGDGRYRYEAGDLDFMAGGDILFVLSLTEAGFTTPITGFDAFFEIHDSGISGVDADLESNDFAAPLGVPNLTIESVVADTTVWAGKPGFLTVTVRNVGPGTACGVYDDDGECTGFALDPFLDPQNPPASYPLEKFGDCFTFINPLGPGLAQTTVISFTLSPTLPGAYPGYCRAASVTEMWFKIDNWDPRAPPNPGPDGLVPEYNERDNVYGPFKLDYDVYLPIVLRNP